MHIVEGMSSKRGIKSMKRKIVVVDDNLDITSFIRDRLKSLNSEYEVIDIENGMKCIWLLGDGHIPDLILLDVNMPEMDGIDVFQKLKENPSWKNIPTVFLVDDGDGFNEFFVSNILNKDYILKPFGPDIFATWVEKRFQDAEINDKRMRR